MSSSDWVGELLAAKLFSGYSWRQKCSWRFNYSWRQNCSWKKNFYLEKNVHEEKTAQKSKILLKEKIVHDGKKNFFQENKIFFKSQRATTEC